MRVVGVDIGGTFTDILLYDTATADAHVHKVRSTPDDPGRAMVTGILELCRQAGVDASDVEAIFHGTTIATNAVLEHKGAVTGLVTTKGFRDIVHIGRHQRPQNYSIMQDIPWQSKPFVMRRHRKVVTERVVPPSGTVLVPLDENEVRAAAIQLREAGVEAVAVCFLFSYLNPEHERRAAAIVREELPNAFVTTSAEISPQFREFERFTTACMNAFVGPQVGRYLRQLERAVDAEGVAGELRVMMSNGGLASVDSAAERPVTLLLSGPAAGILGGVWAGELSGRGKLITFDMGGTSADIGIVTERGVTEASARDTSVGEYPLLVPMIDVHTIGAGGGSIAHLDEGDAFRVGPHSAGAVPGPACYGLGGEEPTITDANVVLGRIDPDRFLGGEIRLEPELARDAVRRLADRLGLGLVETAEGIVTIANASMARAIRSRTIQKGHDPRDFTLVAFGGAGPLHATEVAESLSIPEVLIPSYPGITSAIGLLTSDLKYDQMRTVFMVEGQIDEPRIDRELAELETELRGRLEADGVLDEDVDVRAGIDCRYVGQGYELHVPLTGDGYSDEALEEFHRLHEREYGHAARDPIEVVNVRVTAVGRRAKVGRLPTHSGSLGEALVGEGESVFRRNGDVAPMPTRYFERSRLPHDEPLKGPAVIFQRDTTVLVPPSWAAVAEASGNLLLTRSER